VLPSYWKIIAIEGAQIFPLVLPVRITWRRVQSLKGNPKYSFGNLSRCHFARPSQIWPGIEIDSSPWKNGCDLIHGTALRSDIFLNCILKFRFLPHRKLNPFHYKDQILHAVQGSNWYLLWEACQTQNHCVAECRFLIVRAYGT